MAKAWAPPQRPNKSALRDFHDELADDGELAPAAGLNVNLRRWHPTPILRVVRR